MGACLHSTVVFQIHHSVDHARVKAVLYTSALHSVNTGDGDDDVYLKKLPCPTFIYTQRDNDLIEADSTGTGSTVDMDHLLFIGAYMWHERSSLKDHESRLGCALAEHCKRGLTPSAIPRRR